VIFLHPGKAGPRIIASVRHLVCNIALLSLALSLHASVPTNSASRSTRSAEVEFENRQVSAHGRAILALTASPANVSFYEEFYPANAASQELRSKPGVLHRLASLIKKAVRR
jgi:hypothetical protein